MSKTPSFVTQSRHGIFYFQCAVPRHLKSDTKVIRKSLGTRNRREALSLARKLWVAMNSENFSEMEAKIREEEEKLSLGKQVYQQLKDCEKETAFHNGDVDNYAIDRFFENLNHHEYEALKLYNDYLNTNSTFPLKNESLQSPQSNSANILIQDNLEKLINGQRGIQHTRTKLSELKKDYIIDKSQHAKKPLAPKTISGYESTIERFILFVGNIESDKLDKDILIKKYLNRRTKFPNQANRKPQYHQGKIPKINLITGKPEFDKSGKPLTVPVYKSIEEILQIAAADSTADYAEARTISNEYIEVVTFLKWGSTRGYIDNSLAGVLEEYIDNNRDSTVLPFSPNDLKLMFENSTYEYGLSFSKPHLHWMPLIALFHGNRISEIAMLYLDDVRKVDAKNSNDSVWVFDIKNDPSRNQSTKNKNSIRMIPIHKAILDLGFLDYAEHLRSIGEERLFPQESSGGDKTSNWFNNSFDGNRNSIGYAENCGVRKETVINNEINKKVFHSFRHTWISRAKELGLDYEKRREISGHGEGKAQDVHAKVYEERHDLKVLKDEIDKIHFDIDISKIKKWESV